MQQPQHATVLCMMCIACCKQNDPCRWTVKNHVLAADIQEVRVANQTGLVASWTPSSSLSMAASCGSLVAVAHGNRVSLLSIDRSDGQPLPQQTAQFDQQVSALALLDVPEGMKQVRHLKDRTTAVLCRPCTDVHDIECL